MRKYQWMMALAAALIMAAGAVNAQSTLIANSAHDLSASGVAEWGADDDDSIDDGQVCVYCHTPHQSNANAPLWNKTYTPGQFDTYDTTVSVTMSHDPNQPGPQSLACLSCHDGTIAVDNLANTPGLNAARTGVNQMVDTDLGYVGTDLSDDHPIGIVYATSVASDGGGLLAAPDGLTLYAGIVECATCHSVHDPSNDSFLRADNTGSALCYDCHVK